jgi:hypothetical protein
VHADVFRAPTGGMLLSVLLGCGTQIVVMFVITLAFACLGFLSPATRGGLMTSMVVLWVTLGAVGGYVAARFYKVRCVGARAREESFVAATSTCASFVAARNRSGCASHCAGKRLFLAASSLTPSSHIRPLAASSGRQTCY